MSWEGYKQVWCENGHYLTRSVPYVWADMPEEPDPCDLCKGKIAYENIVDDTNCDSWGKIEPVLKSEAVTEVCNLGHKHVTVPETYEIPDESTPRLYREMDDEGNYHWKPIQRV